MGLIYKYEIIRRKQNIFILAGTMLLLTVSSVFFNIVESKGILPRNSLGGILGALAILACTFIPMGSFFFSNFGHVSELLFRDTSYLVLSIPQPAWKIILGRFLAGLTEFTVYVIVSVACFTAFIITSSPSTEGEHIIKQLILEIGKNGGLFVMGLVYFFVFYGMLGMSYLFCMTTLRSFFNKKTMVLIVSVVIFFLMVYFFSWIANTLTEVLGWTVDIKFEFFDMKNVINFQILSPIIFLIISVGLLLASAWMIENKVEV